MNLFLYICTVAVVILVYYIVKAWKINQHWKERGVPHVKPVLFFGNLLDLIRKKRTQSQIIADIYGAFPNEPVVGYYHFLSPRLIIRDQELVEKVLIRDFHHFVDRGPSFNPKGNPLLLNLFILGGNHWRAMRSKLSPMFTTGKLRFMFPQVNSLADELMKLLEKKSSNLDMKDQTSKFAMEVISTCAFGIEPGSLEGEETEFSQEAKMAFASGFIALIRRLIVISLPKLASLLNLAFLPHRTVDYFSGIVRQAINHRRATGLVRNDFVQQMVHLLDKGFIEIDKYDPGDDYLRIDEKNSTDDSLKLELTVDVMIGQSFVFLLAGFETTATAITFLCFDLATNQEAQSKAREEINKAVASGGELTHDRIRDLVYLEGCMKESLRLHPPVGQLTRNCVKRYEIPGTSLTVEPGEFVIVPAQGIHRNPDIFPEPDKFRPERWNADISYPPCSFLSFGDGPRICIGMRFAIMEIKCCLVKLLPKYKLSLHPSVDLPIKLNPYAFFDAPMKPLIFNLENIK